MIRPNPYTTGYLENTPEDTTLLYRRPIRYDTSLGDRFHTVMEGDTLLHLANIYYGDSAWWFIIFDVNEILDPFELTLGEIIVIPDIIRVKALIS